MPANDPGSDFEYNANSFLRSPPSTPSNHSRPLLKGHSSPASLTSFAHLTPSSSAAELASNPHSRVHYLPSPSFSFDHKRTRSRTGLLPPSRTHFLPVQSSLQAQTLIVRPGSPQFALDMSRTSSPTRRSRALSPGRGDRITRPQSRCESLLRDTLKRDEHERYRNASRSPGRWNERKPRARGNSFLAALKAEDSCGSDDERDENIFHHGSSSKNTHVYFTRSPHLTVHARTSRGHGVGYPTSPSDDGIHYPYGSPSSPSPPSMLRTRTAPVLHAKASTTFENDRSSATSKSSPRAERRSLPLTSMHSHDASPKQQHGSLTPHESILRAKLEYVLQRSGPEETKPMGRRRNHHRAQTQGVTINTGVMKPTQENAITPSPQLTDPTINAIHASEIQRVRSTPPGRRRNSSRRQSPESPPELLTPPPTPPFDARTAAETCKRMDGYVSFASVEGLGEPPGLDMDSDDSEEGLRRWAKWLRMWPFTHTSENDAGHMVVGRHRSDSGSGSSN